MKEPIGAGLVAGALAVTAGGGASIVVEGWPEAAVYYRAREDGRVDDAEARAIAVAAGRFFADLETAGAELMREARCRAS